jgi:V/A-type H+-transporting ATPase subunit I
MRSREHALMLPARMVRVAVVSPRDRLRDTLVVLADAGVFELSSRLPAPSGETLEALRRVERGSRARAARPSLTSARVPAAELERKGASDLLAGEVELERCAATAIEHGSFAALVGWTPTYELGGLAARLSGVGAAAIELDRPPWAEPPTLIARRRIARPFRPLVETYGSARYADVDPTLFAALAFVLMFGMMFGDVGHGALVALLALCLRFLKGGRLASLRRIWPLPFAAGLSAAFFGFLYGECFGPTGIVPTLWLDPIDDAPALLAAAVVVGAGLLTASYAFGTVNRWREEGMLAAIVAPSGVAGTAIFLGGGIAGAGWYLHALPVEIAGATSACVGLVLLASGYALHAGRGGLAVLEVAVEVVEGVIRICASTISFTRLAAFGVMHAALGAAVWDATRALWGSVTGSVVAVLVMFVGNALAFSLELLVAGVQALRLEYFELFSRVFAGEGHVFSPWHIDVTKEES